MSLTLQKCKLISGHLAPVGAKETLSFSIAFQRLAPSKQLRAKLNIIQSRPGDYLGLVRSESGQVSNFRLVSHGLHGDVKWFLKINPDFSSRLVEVYQVDDIQLEKRAEDITPPSLTVGESE